MTSRQIFEAVQIELVKISSPTLKLYEFNYLCNKAITQYVNKIYNIYDTNQQTTDDLRVLSSTASLIPKRIEDTFGNIIYEVTLPEDYLHLLNCICIFNVDKPKNCWKAGQTVTIPATRLTSDSWGTILTNVYNRPSPTKPYYYIHNHKDQETKKSFTLKTPIKLPETKCEIRYGNNDSIFKLVQVQIDYLRLPQFVRLTQEQVDLTIDTSQIMEFPDYVNQEIINELVHLAMEHSGDPRLPNNIQITQSIARPNSQAYSQNNN